MKGRAFFLAIALGVLFGLHRIVDPDVFQQVAVGRAILSEPGSLGVSSFLFTFPGYPYVEDKWLASVLAALFDSASGPHGLMVYQILLAALAGAAFFALFRVWGGGPEAALAGAALCLAACAFRLEPRPDTLSLALVALMGSLVRSRLTFRRALWVLPAVMVVWVNLHGYFLNGLLVLAAALVAAALGDAGALPAMWQQRSAASWRRGAALLALATAACVVHPQGWKALASPFRQLLMLRGEPILRQSILEFQPSSSLFEGIGAARWTLLAITAVCAVLLVFVRAGRSALARSAAGIVAALPWLLLPPETLRLWPHRLAVGLLIAALFEAFASIRERRVLGPMLLAGSLLLAFPVIRNASLIPPAALLLLVPAWTRAGGELAGRVPGRAGGAHRLAWAGRAAAVALVVVVAWARLADHLAPGTYRAPGWTGWGIDGARFPVAAAELIRKGIIIPGPLLNNFDSGGYLLYRLHPPRQVFIAGNTSMYPPSFLAAYRHEVLGGDEDPEALHERYGADLVVLDTAAMDTPRLIGRLARSLSWALVHLDRGGAVFARRDDRAAAFIARHEVRLDDAATASLAEGPGGVSPLPGWLFPRRRAYPALNIPIFLRACGRPDLAAGSAARSWDAAPTEETAVFLALAAEEAGRLDGEVPRLELAVAAFPRSMPVRGSLARALFFRAESRLAGQELPAARRDLERSLELTPGAPGTGAALARVLALQGEVEAARRLLAESLESEPKLRDVAARDPVLSTLLP